MKNVLVINGKKYLLIEVNNDNPNNRNSGEGNSGVGNSGDYNSGDCNTGHRDSGDCNFGAHNSGDYNSGDWNSGDFSFGDHNSGHHNSGDYNTGDCNSGHQNSGEGNSGDYNTGDYNSGDYNSGILNTITPPLIIFNKETSIKRDEINIPDFFIFSSTKFTYSSEMTDVEKKEHQGYEITGGYLKTCSYKEVWRNAWDKAAEEDRKKVLLLPNFDNEIFLEITGIDVNKELKLITVYI